MPKRIHRLDALHTHNLLLLTCGPWDNTIRPIQPLIVSAEQVNQALEILGDSLREVSAA